MLFRSVRWDRAGAIVTKKFDYTRTPQILADFIWRYAHLSREQRGWDPTASALSDDAGQQQAQLFTEAMERFLYPEEETARVIEAADRTLKTKNSRFPLWRIAVKNTLSSEPATLIVGRPFAGDATDVVCGRFTRAYLAYHVEADRVVFLKDGWREAEAFLGLPEADTYAALRAHGVPHLPVVIAAGDVLGTDGLVQRTCTGELVDDAEGWDHRGDYEDGGDDDNEEGRDDSPYLPRIHHRVVQEIAYPLDQATDVREFVQVLLDALTGLYRCCNLYIISDLYSLSNRRSIQEGTFSSR